MKCSSLIFGVLATLAAAQTPSPYTDVKSGITFNTLQHSSGMFFGLALPANATGNTDFIATIGGKGTGWSGVSLGVGSFRKTAQYASPAVATGAFTQTTIANGTYVNSTHWTYTFLCSKCIQTDGTTFKPTDAAPSLGFALNPTAPAQKTNPASSVSKHTAQGQAVFDLSKAKNAKFEVWKGYAVPKVATGFAG
ncbi:uncharacterized protein J4E88_007167 [Alternaria novae-zelandiae]|uniref:uncharacterized protein n=1 Tax=Alternaria novae-zelandiae TaxID=430562 RepID=UPI0020C28F23|nr:uncharacterized protein J4E88_007167 [Alternaria novae-zelandiae]KAI4677359.1 hypothetical protein J4E88_007167 [Alternaria novae-zelandiae]